MTDVCFAVIICSVITILFYIVSWFRYEQNDEKKPVSFNIQGLDKDEPISRSQPNEILNFDSDRSRLTGEIIKEKSDITRLQYEDFRSRLTETISREESIPDDYVNIEPETDPVVHPDDRLGRLHLLIKYDDERSKLFVQILDAEGLIRSTQTYAPEMMVTFTLIGPYHNDNETEKHTRVVVENAAITWKQPMTFVITLATAIKQHLYVSVTNETDPAAPRDREISIALNKLANPTNEINEWFELNFVQSSY